MSAPCVVERVTERPPRAYALRVVNETCVFPCYCWSLREPATRAPLTSCIAPRRFFACGPSRRMEITIEGVRVRGGEVSRRPSLLQGAAGAWPEWCAIVHARSDVVGNVVAFLREANQGEAFA